MNASNSILQLIGNTPLVKINNLTKGLKGVEVYAKMEGLNPGGSSKDRSAWKMIEDGEKSGKLVKDKIILDSTSGNTGISYAMIGAAKGYSVEIVLPENASLERKKVIWNYGAKIIFSNPLEGSDGAQKKALLLYEENPGKYFMPDQYNNPSNPKAHYLTTGVEVIKQTGGQVTHFVAGVGTGGTLMGAGRRLKEFNEDIVVVAVEPDNPFHGIEGLKHMASSIVPGIYDESLLNDKIYVKTEDAYEMTRRIAREEGLLVGHSSGAAMVGALALAKRIEKGLIVIIFPDRGDRYLTRDF